MWLHETNPQDLPFKDAQFCKSAKIIFMSFRAYAHNLYLVQPPLYLVPHPGTTFSIVSFQAVFDSFILR